MAEVQQTQRELRLGFVFDHNKCIICNACVDACNKAYGGNWRVLPVFQFEGATTALSISCNHCDNPVCLKACPANAIKKERNGIVYVNQQECIGCGYCQWACPYEALHFTKDGTMSKCHLCMDRLGKGMPYCVESCPTGALSFGWLGESDAQVNYLAPPSITKPRFKIIPPRDMKILASPLKEKSESNVKGLIAFTVGSEISLGYALFKLPYYPLLSFLLLASTLLLSVGHAKVSSRSIRVMFNLKTSWLSREVLFGGLASLLFLLEEFFYVLYYPALIFLGLSVISSFMIYMLKSRPSWYSPDTPISFLGTAFTTISPIAFFLSHQLSLLALGGAWSLVEIISWYLYKRDVRIRGVLNLIYLVSLMLPLITPFTCVVPTTIALLSEIYHRTHFFKKVKYYGVPKY